MKALTLTRFFVFISLLGFATACQKPHTQAIKPAEHEDWELVKAFEGHHGKVTDRFKLNGNNVVIAYEVESEGHYTHSKLDVQLGTGAEGHWSNPAIQVFNQDHVKGEEVFQNPGKGLYLLKINALNAHYHIKVYQKASEE